MAVASHHIFHVIALYSCTHAQFDLFLHPLCYVGVFLFCIQCMILHMVATGH